jgi:hypothetical protein
MILCLQANTVNTYGYYLNLADRKEEALKAMQTGMALFDRLDDDGAFYFDKREFDEKKIEKTASKCYNENNDKLKAEERRNFLWNR